MSSLIKSVIAQAMVRDVGYGVPSQDQVSTAVDAYLQRNPVEPGATTEEAAQIRQNTEAVGALKQSDEQQNTEIQKHSTAIENLQNNETGNGSGGNANQGTGWTTEQIDLLDSLLSNVSFNSENGGAIADMLIASLRSGASSGGGSGDSGGETEPDNPSVQTYTITRNLTGCTSSSSLSSVVGGVSHNETLTAADGYTLDGAIVTITMGDVDITATAYSNGVIDIASVTGNIVISAVMVNTGTPIYEISEPITYDGTEATSVDTGVAIWEQDRDWSIAIDVVNQSQNAAYDVFAVPNPSNRYGNDMIKFIGLGNNVARVYVNGQKTDISDIWFAEKPGNTAKLVVTHAANSDKVVVAWHATSVAGGVSTNAGVELTPGDGWTTTESSLVIGRNGGGCVVNDLEIYKRVLTADEISAYLA